MTREEAKELLPIIQAYAEGKTVQYKYLGKWEDVVSEAYFETYPFTKYRIKPEPKYRPFKSKEECWLEMKRHRPFGWVKPKNEERFYCITILSSNLNVCNSIYKYTEGFNNFTFTDGTPFGIKEE